MQPRRSAVLLALASVIGIAGCAPPRIADGVFACESSEDCPAGWFCRSDERCHAALTVADAATAPDASDDAALDAGCEDCVTCGDAVCSEGEDCSTCAQDCGECAPRCGDGACNGDETCGSCSGDCGACPPVCGDGACNGGESCASCGDCQHGHRGTGNNGDSCDGVPAQFWRCVRSSALGNVWVAQSCQDRNGDGHFVWETFGTSPRDCAACVCTMSPACCQAGSSQTGCR